MARTIIFYALALGVAAMTLNWIEYRYLARAFSTEIYVTLIAAAFIALGIWVGSRLTPRHAPLESFVRNEPRHAPLESFVRNDAAIRSLGLSPREVEILAALASGESNKELARRFGISPNTVKTHIARVYEKLDVQGRVHAIDMARLLALIP